MIRLLLLAALGGVLATTNANHDSGLCEKKLSKLVVCYYEGRVSVQNVEPCLCTHVVHKTAARIAGNFSLEVDAGMSHVSAALKERNPAVKLLLRISPEQYSEPLVKSKQKRANFLSDVGRLLDESQVDGLELDLNLQPRGRTEGLSVLLKDLRTELDKSHKSLFLSIPLRPEVLVKRYDIKNITKYLDYLTVPSHNMTDVSQERVTYHPSRLMGLSDILNTDSVVDLLTGLGAPKEKLVVTLPAKVIRFSLKDKENNTPGSASASPPDSLSQGQFCSLLEEGNWTIEREEDLTAPYAFKDTSWIAFEDPVSTGIKAKYILLRELAGAAVMSVDDEDAENSCSSLSNDTNWVTRTLYDSFTSLARKSRGAVLESLEEDIKESTLLTFSGNIQLSPYRITRIVDTAGDIHVVRKEARTQFECSRQGYFVHPQGCNRFYRCVKYHQQSADFTVFEYDCPAGLAFDERWEVCVWPGSLPRGAPCSGSSEIAPVPRARYACPKVEGYYADPENCRWFFACLDHARNGITPLTAYEFRCPFGLVFDQSKLICDWPWMVDGCGSGVEGAAFVGAVKLSAASNVKYVSASDDNSGILRGNSEPLRNIGYAASYVSGGSSADSIARPNFDRNIPAYAALPDSFISGGRIQNSGGVVLENNFAPVAVQTQHSDNQNVLVNPIPNQASHVDVVQTAPLVKTDSIQPVGHQTSIPVHAFGVTNFGSINSVPFNDIPSNIIPERHNVDAGLFESPAVKTSRVDLPGIPVEKVPIATGQRVLTGNIKPAFVENTPYFSVSPVNPVQAQLPLAEIRRYPINEPSRVVPEIRYAQNVVSGIKRVQPESLQKPIIGRPDSVNIVHYTPLYRGKVLQQPLSVPAVELQVPVVTPIPEVYPRIPVSEQSFTISRPKLTKTPVFSTGRAPDNLQFFQSTPINLQPSVVKNEKYISNTPVFKALQQSPIVQQSFVQQPTLVKTQEFSVHSVPVVDVTPRAPIQSEFVRSQSFVNINRAPAVGKIQTVSEAPIFPQSFVKSPPALLGPPLNSVSTNLRYEIPSTPTTFSVQQTFVQPKANVNVFRQPTFDTLIPINAKVPASEQEFVVNKPSPVRNEGIPSIQTIPSTFEYNAPGSIKTIGEVQPVVVSTPRIPITPVSPVNVFPSIATVQRTYTPVQSTFPRSRKPQILNVTPAPDVTQFFVETGRSTPPSTILQDQTLGIIDTTPKILSPRVQILPASSVSISPNIGNIQRTYTPIQSTFTRSRKPQIVNVTPLPDVTPLFAETVRSTEAPLFASTNLQAQTVDVTPKIAVFSSTTESVPYYSRQPTQTVVRSRIRPLTTSRFVPTSRPAVKIDQAVIADPSGTVPTQRYSPSVLRSGVKSNTPNYGKYSEIPSDVEIPLTQTVDGGFGVRLSPTSIPVINLSAEENVSTAGPVTSSIPSVSGRRLGPTRPSDANVEKLLDKYGNSRNRNNDDFINAVIEDDISRKGHGNSFPENPGRRNGIDKGVDRDYEFEVAKSIPTDSSIVPRKEIDKTEELGTATYYSPDGGIGYETVKIGYDVSPDDSKTPIVVVTRLSDVNPILVAKLGAQCTCRSNAVALRRPNKNRILTPAKLDSQATNILPITRQSSDRPSVTQAVVDETAYEESRSPLRSTTSRYDSDIDRESVPVARTSIPGRALDRYGPGGLRTLDETLQGSVDCQRPGLFRHPKFCNKFYACHWDDCKKRYTLHVFNCPIQLAYDSDLGACNWPSAGPACADNNLLV